MTVLSKDMWSSAEKYAQMLLYISKAFIHHCKKPAILWNLYKQIKEPFFFSFFARLRIY